MQPSTKLITPMLAIVLMAGACGPDAADESEPEQARATPETCPSDYAGADIYPIFVSSEITVGDRSRFLVGLLDSNDAPVSSDELNMTASFEPVSGSGSSSEAAFDYIETVPSQDRGVYVAYPAFDEPGLWKAKLSVEGDGHDADLAGCFQVTAEGSTPAIGAPAPASDVPTADEVDDLAKISTDPMPKRRFYRMSPAEALEKGKPFVLVFATPKYCTSQTCGPTLDIVADVVADYPKLTVIHSEIYKNLEPTNPVVPAVSEWGLPSEPWVFVVNAKGNVIAKYEGSISEEELTPVLESL